MKNMTKAKFLICPDNLKENERDLWNELAPKVMAHQIERGFLHLLAVRHQQLTEYCQAFCEALEIDKQLRKKGIFVRVSGGHLWRRPELSKALRYCLIVRNRADLLGITVKGRN